MDNTGPEEGEYTETEVVGTPTAVALRDKKATSLAPLPEEVSPYQGAGTMELTAEQIELLTSELPPEDHDIKPTGEVFVPQVKYRSILNRVFGPGGWAMIPMSDPQSKQKPYNTILVVQKWHLVAQGKFVAEVVGEMEYRTTNANASEATAIEGAKSNALMRACKDLGIGSECWDKTFTHKFMNDYCVQVEAPNSQGNIKQVWRRKDRPPFKGERPIK